MVEGAEPIILEGRGFSVTIDDAVIGAALGVAQHERARANQAVAIKQKQARAMSAYRGWLEDELDRSLDDGKLVASGLAVALDGYRRIVAEAFSG